MSHPNATPDDVKSQVMAALIAGETVPIVAKRHGLSKQTVYNWMRVGMPGSDPRCVELAPQIVYSPDTPLPDLVGRVVWHVEKTFLTLDARMEHTSTLEYLKEQPAAGVAELQRVDGERAIRLVAAMSAAERRAREAQGDDDMVIEQDA